MTNLTGRYAGARRLILDYALGAAIIALFPIPRIRILKAIALLFLHYKLLRGIKRQWQPRRGGDILARLGIVAGFAGSMTLGLLSWVGVIALGSIIPNLEVLAGGAAFFCYFWSIGQTVNRFYLTSLSTASVPQSLPAPAVSPPSEDET